MFDCEHEKDLEKEVNKFIESRNDIIDIKYQASHFYDNKEQIFSFSCMVIYGNR